MTLAGECSWELLHACNYRCPYCFFIPSWESAPEATNRKHLAVTSAQWLTFWERLRARRGEFRIEVSGGEPLLYPQAPRLLSEVSSLHRLRVITNLSWEPDAAAAFDPARVEFLASFHPSFADEPVFADRLARLRARGFAAAVMLVAYPPSFGELAARKARFEAGGAEVLVSPFQGAFEGRSYPRAYAPAQRAWLKSVRPAGASDAAVALGLLEDTPAGRICGAGATYFRAYPDGEVWRCSSLKDMTEARPLGSILDERLPLVEGPAPCPAAACLCPAEHRQLDRNRAGA